MIAIAAPPVTTLTPRRTRSASDTTVVRSHAARSAARAEMFYGRLAARGVTFGAGLQGAREFWRRDGEALARARAATARRAHVRDGAPGVSSGHPVRRASSAAERERLPAQRSRNRSRISRRGSLVHCVHAMARHAAVTMSATAFTGTIDAARQSGPPGRAIDGFAVRRNGSRRRSQAPGDDAGLYQNRWEPHPRRLARAAPGVRDAGCFSPIAGGVASDLGRSADRAGRRVVMVGRADVDPADPTLPWRRDRRRRRVGGPLAGVVHLWSLDAPWNDALTRAAIADQEARGCGALLHLVAGAAAAHPRRRGSGSLRASAQAVERAGPRAPRRIAQAPSGASGGSSRSIIRSYGGARSTCRRTRPASARLDLTGS